MEGDVRAALEEEWGAAKGYLQIENQRPVWIADSDRSGRSLHRRAPEHVYLLTDANGEAARTTPIPTTRSASIRREEIRRVFNAACRSRKRISARDKSGMPYLIKAGRMPDDKGRPYFFAIGRSLDADA